jgi:NAD(P)-dependent dehydrogenase (short-subunit alcohol dehydrogenase family)
MSLGVFLITGGTRGIGAATARLAAERGYKVAVLYRSNEAAAQRLADETGAVAIQADVADERALTAASRRSTSWARSRCW